MQASDGMTYWVYITASKPHGVLYIGMTSDLAGRTWEHRERLIGGFTKRAFVVASLDGRSNSAGPGMTIVRSTGAARMRVNAKCCETE